MRKTYLDNIRWSTVVLVMVYHVCYLFNGVGILGRVPGPGSLPAGDMLAAVVYPWFMVLLFVVAGISARFALEKRTAGQFLRERAQKLLLPSTAGLFVLHWVTGYLNIKMGGGLEFIPPFLLYPIAAVSGTGPLWFIQLLFLFSCALVLIRKADRGDRLWQLGGRAGGGVILLLALLIWGAAQVGNVPVLTMYRFGIYFAAFLIGYCVLSHKEAMDRVERMGLPLLAAALGGAVAFGAYYRGTDYTAPVCLQSLFTNLYLWAAVLAILGCARRYFDRETPFTRYMTGVSFGWYILHYPVLLAVCYVLATYMHLPPVGNYLMALVLEFVLVPGVYEAVRRIPVVRYLVLGIKKR